MADKADDNNIETNANGTPFFKRKVCCSDILFLIIFIVFFVGLVVMWGIAAGRGDIRRLTYPMDFQGNLCGMDNGNGKDFSDKKYLAWYDPTSDDNTDICVKMCRSEALEMDDPPINTEQFGADELSVYGVEGTYARYDDISVLRRCQPKDLTNLPEHVRVVLGGGASTIFGDLEEAWWVIFVMCILAVLLCVLYIFLLRMFANELLWFTVIATICLVFTMAVVLLAAGTDKLPEDYLDTHTVLERDLTDQEKQRSTIVGALLVVLTLILIIVVYWLRKSISLVGRMIEEAGLIAMDVPAILFFPALPMLFALGWTALWLYFTMLIASTSSMDTAKEANFTAGQRVEEMDNVTQLCMAYNVFAFLWIVMMISAVTRTTIAGVGSTWYFVRDKDSKEGKSDQLSGWLVSSTFARTLRYNLGSIALGSLILTIAFIIRFICNVFTNLVNKNSKNSCVVWWTNCVNCCVNAIVKCIEYITKYAYIEIAMYGIDFFSAASRSGHMMKTYLEKVAVVDSVGDLMLFLCKLAVTFTVAFICDAILGSGQLDVQNPRAITMICMVFAYLVATSFFSVLETMIDTVLVCFCEDVDSGDPENGREYYMRPEFKEFIDQQKNLIHGDAEKS